MRTPLDDYTSAEIAALKEMQGSGNARALMLHNNVPLKTFPGTLSTYRLKAILWGRWRILGQDMGACALSPGEEHEPEEDVAAVRFVTTTDVKRWYRSSSVGTPSYSLYSTLTWEQTAAISPESVLMKRVDGGGLATLPSCTTVYTGEDPPEHWDGYDQPGFIFYSESDPTVVEDSSILTGAAMASAGQGGEVALVTSDWAVRKRFGARWVDGSDGLFLESFSGADAPKTTAASVRRLVYEFNLVGHRIASTIKWTETRVKTGEDPVVEEKFVEIDANTDWLATVEVDYPAYGYAVNISNLRIVPI